ncbi:MAG: EipB family protein [Alphaproteobacteria bacterium]
MSVSSRLLSFGLSAAIPLAAGLIAAGALRAPQAAAAGVELAPHRAIYSMKLAGTRSGSAMADARGAMYVEAAESCDGWTVTQRVQLRLVTAEGESSETESSYSSWESKDGRDYRFTVRRTHDGQPADELRGDASLGENAGPGEARFTTPAGTRFDLPKASVFPTEHTLQLIETARAGGKHLSRVIFDGASLDGPLEVNAVIGGMAKDPVAANGAAELTAGSSWRIRMAFFPLSSQAATPDYEVGVRLFDNGVADGFLLDYGTYSVLASLEKLEALPKPRC